MKLEHLLHIRICMYAKSPYTNDLATPSELEHITSNQIENNNEKKRNHITYAQ